MPDAHPETVADFAALVLGEYDLGTPVHVEPLGASGHRAFKVMSPRGRFVAKPASRPADIALHAQVAAQLNAHGIRQGRIEPTRSTTYVAESGYFLGEFLDGDVHLRPTASQTIATMTHLGHYLNALGQVDADWRPDDRSFWTRVADVEYMLSVLPRHLADGSEQDGRVLESALDYLGERAAAIATLDRQLVHGDVAPDNVVMAGDDVVAIIDFTPFWEPALFAVACAVYWFHVNGNDALSVDEIVTSLRECGRSRPWSRAELALAPAMLVREALRRLATVVEAAEPLGVSRTSLASRRRNLRLIMHTIGSLEERASGL